jgi:hypothetical protein
MSFIDRHDLLRCLDTAELLALARQFELPADEETAKDILVERLAGTTAATMGQMLMALPRSRLKELCRARGLDDCGREKELIATRLLGIDLAAAPAPRAVPPHRRGRRRPTEG